MTRWIVLFVLGLIAATPCQAGALDVLATRMVHFRQISYRTCSNQGCTTSPYKDIINEARLANNTIFVRSPASGSGTLYSFDRETDLLTHPLTRSLFEGMDGFELSTAKATIVGDTLLLEKNQRIKSGKARSVTTTVTKLELRDNGCVASQDSEERIDRDLVRKHFTMSCELAPVASDAAESAKTTKDIRFFNLLWSGGNRTTLDMNQRNGGFFYQLTSCGNEGLENVGVFFPADSGTSRNAYACPQGTRSSVAYEARTEREPDRIAFKATGVMKLSTQQTFGIDIAIRLDSAGKCTIEKFVVPNHRADAKSYCTFR